MYNNVLENEHVAQKIIAPSGEVAHEAL